MKDQDKGVVGAPRSDIAPAVRMGALNHAPMRLSKPTSTERPCCVGLPPKPKTKACAGRATNTSMPNTIHMLPDEPGSVNSGQSQGQENAERQPAKAAVRTVGVIFMGDSNGGRAHGVCPPETYHEATPARRHAYRKMPSLPRMKISSTAPAIETTKRMMPPAGAMPSAPAIQKPNIEPTTPTSTLAIQPIWASVFMNMLASQPTMPPMINEMIQPMSVPLSGVRTSRQRVPAGLTLPFTR